MDTLPENSPLSKKETDSFLLPHIQWLNENGYRTVSSCSGLQQEHQRKNSSVPHIIFNKQEISKEKMVILKVILNRMNGALIERFQHLVYYLFIPDIFLSQRQQYPDSLIMKTFDTLLAELEQNDSVKILNF